MKKYIFFLATCSGALSLAAELNWCADVVKQIDSVEVQSRLQATKEIVIPVSSGRNIHFFFTKPAQAQGPVLLLLPGMARNFFPKEQVFKELTASGVGLASMSFSVQPTSLLTLKHETPYFKRQTPNPSDFIQEIQVVTERLQSMGNENIIPVTLSYSAALSPLLSQFPLIIETVPMTSEAEANPTAHQVRNLIETMNSINPFFGSLQSRMMINSGYQMAWNIEIDKLVREFGFPRSKSAVFSAGYNALARAAEGSDWRDHPFSKKSQRVFVLGSLEKPSLLKNQIQNILRLREKGHDVLVYFVFDGVHLIPLQFPKIYAQILGSVAAQGPRGKTGLYLIRPGSPGAEDAIDWIGPSDFTKALQDLLKEVLPN